MNRRLGIVVLLLLGTGGCGTPTEPGKACEVSAECPAPQRCYFPTGDALGSGKKVSPRRWRTHGLMRRWVG